MADTKPVTSETDEEQVKKITVDAARLQEALKHALELEQMLVDCIGMGVPVKGGDAIREQTAAMGNNNEQTGTNPLEKGLTEVYVKVPWEEEGAAKTFPAPAAITKDDLIRIIVRKIKLDRANNELIGAILKSYGVSRVSDLPDEKYEAFLTDLTQI